jgi:hypothetical protein
MDVGSVIGGGFRLIREKPAAVAVWAFLYLLAIAAMNVLTRPLMQAQMQALGGDPQIQVANVGAMMGRILLMVLVFLLLYIVLFAASQRAVLQPERRAFFYLRLGMDELRLFALAILFIVGFYVVMILLILIMVLLVGLFASTAGKSFGMAIGFIATAYVALLIFGAWFSTRFALAFPLTLMRGKIIIGESWRLTRGRFWPLFAAFFVVFLMLLMLWTVASLVTNGSYFAQLARSGADPVVVQQAGQQQMARQLGGIDGMMVLGWILGAAAGALGVALWGGAVATAARQLTFNPDEIAETFA